MVAQKFIEASLNLRVRNIYLFALMFKNNVADITTVFWWLCSLEVCWEIYCWSNSEDRDMWLGETDFGM